MRKIILLALAVVFCTCARAQSAKEEIKKNTRLSASNYLAYPGLSGNLTPAPDGLSPFYISHYGSYGSCNIINQTELTYPYECLTLADRHDKLTWFGKEVLRRLVMIHDDVKDRLGELTPLGADQQKQIARRMFDRFPEVFKGNAHVDAKSTTVIRCILSMENALQQLLTQNHKLIITHDASEHDMYFMNQSDSNLWNKKMISPAQTAYNDYCIHHDRSAGVMQRLFSDTAYINREVNAERLNYYLFKLASNLQNMELRKKITLYDVFNDDEIYHNWLKDNAWWYIAFGPCPLNGGTQPFSQRNLLRTIIQQADSCIRQPKPGAMLRFGHETTMLSLACLLEINDFGLRTTELEQLERKGWRNYRIFPMASNLQFIFYRHNFSDKDVIFKVLLNENEVKLPLKTNMEPYYLWSDFKAYFLKKLDSYGEIERLRD
jgi:hypothetical protein